TLLSCWKAVSRHCPAVGWSSWSAACSEFAAAYRRLTRWPFPLAVGKGHSASTTGNEAAMAITMYDLAGAEAERRFSPFCWRARMALAHKGLDVETVPWRFTEKDKLPAPNAGRVPVIVDGGRVVHDSSAIADYLEERYADRPNLFPGGAARGLSKFVQNW